jgi:acyl-CoA synthetase (AMP-forming)/AMP-acid ligase II
VLFVGRVKNMIKRSGENISAEEVELVLAEHPDVAEATVFAVPDPVRTEEVFAAIVRRPGAVASPAELRAFGAERLVRWKLPRYIAVLDQPLPRLANGKLDRVRLRASLELKAAWDYAAS